MSKSATATVNVDANSTWVGGFLDRSQGGGVQPSFITVNGGSHATFNASNLSAPESSVTNVKNGTAIINIGVTGTGGFQVIGDGQDASPISKLEFGASVGSGQTVTLSSTVPVSEGAGTPTLQIDHPDQFLAMVQFQNSGAGNEVGEINLMGLATADGYGYQNDMLSIFSGKNVIGTLRLNDSSPYGFEVEKTSGGVSILGYTDASHTPVGTVLPIHT